MLDTDDHETIKDQAIWKRKAQLRHGPYACPPIGIGDVLYCERWGEVKVAKWSDGPITWPCARYSGRYPLILCGDLVRAVRVESHQTVAYHWGVSPYMATQWRGALGTPRWNEGTRQLQRDSIGENITPEGRARSYARMRDPEVVAKVQKTISERGTWPSRRAWTSLEDALLGTIPDRILADRFGCALSTVASRRQMLGIPPTRVSESWKVSSTARKMKSGILRPRREALGRSQKEIAEAMGVGSVTSVSRGEKSRLSLSKRWLGSSRLCSVSLPILSSLTLSHEPAEPLRIVIKESSFASRR